MRSLTAPIAFLAAVTAAVLLIRGELHHGGHPTATRTTTQTTQTTPRHHRHKKQGDHHRPHVVTYTVRSGDTLGSIAGKEGTTVARLEQLNPNVNPTALQVGQTIRVR